MPLVKATTMVITDGYYIIIYYNHILLYYNYLLLLCDIIERAPYNIIVFFVVSKLLYAVV